MKKESPEYCVIIVQLIITDFEFPNISQYFTKLFHLTFSFYDFFYDSVICKKNVALNLYDLSSSFK